MSRFVLSQMTGLVLALALAVAGMVSASAGLGMELANGAALRGVLCADSGADGVASGHGGHKSGYPAGSAACNSCPACMIANAMDLPGPVMAPARLTLRTAVWSVAHVSFVLSRLYAPLQARAPPGGQLS